MTANKIAVALSGGVDSSVAALLLRQAGYEVFGMHMLLWKQEGSLVQGQSNSTSPTATIERIEKFCKNLKVPLYLIDFQSEFKRRIVDYFCQEYFQGHTPNPCIQCNKQIKFGLLLERASLLGATLLATGHYVRTKYSNGSYHLLKGLDAQRDLSYFLYTLDQDRLSKLLFPLGGYPKSEVYEIARKNNLEAVSVASSQDICFVSSNYSDFFKQSFTLRAGEIVDQEGNLVGCHGGLPLYTIGQRHRLGIASGRRLYVTRIKPSENRIVVGEEQELYKTQFSSGNVSWINGMPSESLDVTVKIRYKSPAAKARISIQSDHVNIHFTQAQKAITPGQAAVFYQNDEVIGGSTIES
jgi:tRNA-specific 2-thiouridylase